MRWLDETGIGGWEHHHRIVVPSYGPIEIDIAWPDERVAWELEGVVHRQESLVHSRDTARQNTLALAGWLVLRTTYPQWLRRNDAVLADVRTALVQRAA